MKKIITRVINGLLLIVVAITLISAIGSAITKEPILLSVIRSNSMYPVWERGDMVLIQNFSEDDEVEMGDIIFYKAEKGNLSKQGWIAHRVIEGNNEVGFIAKGDANEDPDETPVQRGWISGRAVTIEETPIVIPKLGFLSLWMEQFQSNPYILPIFAVILAIIVGISELTSNKKARKKKKENGIELQLIYISAGMTIAVILAATMLMSSQKLNIVYEVSEEQKGVLMGSAVGILKPGDEVTKPLSTLNNGGKFNLIGTITTNDEQIQTSKSKLVLKPGDNKEISFTVTAVNPGKYESSIQVGLFYPFLPSSLIYALANTSFWLALVVLALIPGLPFMMYPFLDGKMRRGIFKYVRLCKNRFVNKMPF